MTQNIIVFVIIIISVLFCIKKIIKKCKNNKDIASQCKTCSFKIKIENNETNNCKGNDIK